MHVVVGAPVPLALKLYDSNEAAKVRADIFSQFGDFLGSEVLFHAQDGLYLSSQYFMPDWAIVVVYKVTNSEEYADSAEQFFPLPKVQEPEKFVTGTVKSIKNQSEYIVGVLK